MPRGVSTLFSQREEAGISDISFRLLYTTEAYGATKRRLLAAEQTVEAALSGIRNSSLDEQQKNLITDIIERLEKALVRETQHDKLAQKYEAVAAMLQQCVLDQHATLEVKAQAMETYLAAFRVPTSQVELKVKRGLAVTSIALLLGLCVASWFVVPLIPFTAAFAAMGLTGWILGAAAATSGFVVKVGGVIMASLLMAKLNEMITEPLSRLFQKASDEYRAATAAGNQIRHCFFAEHVPAGNGAVNLYRLDQDNSSDSSDPDESAEDADPVPVDASSRAPA